MKTLLRVSLILLIVVSLIGMLMGAHHQVAIFIMVSVMYVVLFPCKKKQHNQPYRRTFKTPE